MHCNSKLLHQKILSNECAVVRNFLCAQVLLYELAVTSVALLVGLAISCHELWYKSIWQCCWCSLYQTVWIYTRYYQYAFIFPYFLYRLEVCSLFFVHLFRPSQTTLTLKAVIQILKPVFSEEGSNSRQLENSVYSAYLKYLRAVASKYASCWAYSVIF